MPTVEPIVLAAAGLVLLGVLASKASSRLGVPALLLFLGLGMLAGSEGPGGIDFTDYDLAGTVGVVALAFILFAGGLDTQWDDVRPVAAPGIALATVGVLVTALIAGWVASLALGLTLLTGFLLGAIISSTDAAAVFSVLRARQASLRGRLRPLLELESGSNDPMAVFLTVGFVQLLQQPDRSVAMLVPLFVQQMLLGAVVGLVLARAAVALINRLRLEYDGLYPVMTLAIVPLAYNLATVSGGNGFLTVYLAGMVMGNTEFLHKKSLMRFHDAMAWLGQIAMFVMLGLLVFPSRLLDVAGPSLLVAAALIAVARPAAVLAVLAVFRVPLRETALVSWVGLRGAVPIILATFPLVEDIEHADTIFDAVFFIVITSVLIQGTTLPLVARKLGVDAPMPPQRAFPIEAVSTDTADATLHELLVPDGCPVAGRQLVEIGLPEGVLVVLMNRDGQFVVPQGRTVLEAGDELLVLASPEHLGEVRELLRPRVED